jgi:hypothetical protein
MAIGIGIGIPFGRRIGASTSITYIYVSSGLIIYRKGIRGGYYCIDYSDDNGVTWELNLVQLETDEDTIIISIDSGVDGYRHEVRDNDYCIDQELTPTGFEGTEDIDWENVFKIYK